MYTVVVAYLLKITIEETCMRAILPFIGLLRDMIKALAVKEHCNRRQIIN